MYQVNAANLPGNEIARTFEGSRHGPSSVSFFLVHNHPGQARLVCIHAAPAMHTKFLE
jgi:hypothetical protein